MTELVAVLIIAVLAFLQHRVDQRRLDDAFTQLAAANRQLRAQADPGTFVWTDEPPSTTPGPAAQDTFWLTDASGLLHVEVAD